MDKTIKKITAKTKNSRYDVYVGESILSRIKLMDNILLRDRFAVIISSRVMELYKEAINSLFKEYCNFDIFIMRDGEINKNYRYAEDFLGEMLKKGYTRKSSVVAIGGGVTGDFAGFIASIFMRGIPVIQIPTTLLAMVDSSIGGKVAVNLSAGKNIAGTFHQPEMVISDVNFIKTLPDNELKNGLTEVLKHALIGEKKTLNILDKNDLESIRKNDILGDLVSLSVMFKKNIVEEDENETGRRAVLNFGHTAGHAIESLMEYNGISHGEAVALGLRIETEISRRIGWISDSDNKYINDLIKKYGLVYNDYRLNPDDVIDHMKYDKKNFSGRINFVLLKGLGNPVYNQEVNQDILKDVTGSL